LEDIYKNFRDLFDARPQSLKPIGCTYQESVGSQTFSVSIVPICPYSGVSPATAKGASKPEIVLVLVVDLA